jgi:hypothetical protein
MSASYGVERMALRHSQSRLQIVRLYSRRIDRNPVRHQFLSLRSACRGGVSARLQQAMQQIHEK